MQQYSQFNDKLPAAYNPMFKIANTWDLLTQFFATTCPHPTGIDMYFAKLSINMNGREGRKRTTTGLQLNYIHAKTKKLSLHLDRKSRIAD
jgi:hypothetical protein